MIHIYKVFDASRKTHTYRSDKWKRPAKMDPDGNVRLGTGLYRVDADRVGHETRTKWLFFRVDAMVHYYRSGNPEPMDPLGLGFDTEVPAHHMKTFADSTFIRHLFKSEMDYTTILLIIMGIAIIVEGFIIYTVVKH